MVRKIPVLLILIAINLMSCLAIVVQVNAGPSALAVLLNKRPLLHEQRSREGNEGRAVCCRPSVRGESVKRNARPAEPVSLAGTASDWPRDLGPYREYAEAEDVAWAWEIFGFAVQIIPGYIFGPGDAVGWIVHVAEPPILGRLLAQRDDNDDQDRGEVMLPGP